MYASVGDIAQSKLWLSVDWQLWRKGCGLHFGPTYNGTIRGIVLSLGPLVIIGHQRDNEPEAKEKQT